MPPCGTSTVRGCTRTTAQAALDLTAHLISLGHRRIAFIGGPEGLYASRDRLEGFRAAMAAAGLPDDLVHEGDFGYDRGFEATRRMIEQESLPDAVIGANDATAIGALGALRAATCRCRSACRWRG